MYAVSFVLYSRGVVLGVLYGHGAPISESTGIAKAMDGVRDGFTAVLTSVET
jgi:hypothetical protein